ncbi:MAG: hypothetical protein QM706_14325 [Nitrospira sp.]
MDSDRPTIFPLIRASRQSFPLQNNCALRPFPAGMPYESAPRVISDGSGGRIPFFLAAGRDINALTGEADEARTQPSAGSCETKDNVG